MQGIDLYNIPPDLMLGTRLVQRIPAADQERQRTETQEILTRLRTQSGVILADEVGMGKTFVALSVAYTVASQSPRGPVILMVPANLVDKWEQDLKTFCELYLSDRFPVRKEECTQSELRASCTLRYGVARHSVELMKLLDDPPRDRCHMIFLAQGAMGRQQTDKWIRLALIGEAMRRHGRGAGRRLIQVKSQIHRFVAQLIRAVGEQKFSDWGEDVWQTLLQSDPSAWREAYNKSIRDSQNHLTDDPVPKTVGRAIRRLELRQLADALEKMPVRARGGDSRVSERIAETRRELRNVEENLWKELLAAARWRSPLLVMDEAHHLKNPATALARQLQSPDSDQDLRTGDGAMSKAFDRMLFLTATPFQLGHHELVSVLRRFGDVCWDNTSLGEHEEFAARLTQLGHSLTESQRTAVGLQRCWTRLRKEDLPDDNNTDQWWEALRKAAPEQLTPRQRALVDSFVQAARWRHEAQTLLRPWVIRHNKPERWSGTEISRRQRMDGAAILDNGNTNGLDIPPDQLLPFFLAARSAASSGHDLLGEALCSSYEAFRFTRKSRELDRDAVDDEATEMPDLTQSAWYLAEFDAALTKCTGHIHPKISATVNRTVNLWESGEKVLVFTFYRQTCRALRVHISAEIERRITTLARRRLAGVGRPTDDKEIKRILESVQNRFFDRADSPGREALDRALVVVTDRRKRELEKAGMGREERDQLLNVMRRFLRVPTTLVRCFPIHQHESLAPHLAVRSMLDTEDGSGLSWRSKFEAFMDYLLDGCSSSERAANLEAAARTQTGGIRVEAGEEDDDNDSSEEGVTTLANIKVATGATGHTARSRLMRAFNTPFFPDILVCTQVMGEGVDLQRSCRHVIHHDLAWNPSNIEQRTGRIDRLGCKAENRHPICVYLPYIAGTADERQYKVMTDREQWFRIVMGQDEVAKLIPSDADLTLPPLPDAIGRDLGFHLGLR